MERSKEMISSHAWIFIENGIKSNAEGKAEQQKNCTKIIYIYIYVHERETHTHIIRQYWNLTLIFCMNILWGYIYIYKI